MTRGTHAKHILICSLGVLLFCVTYNRSDRKSLAHLDDWDIVVQSNVVIDNSIFEAYICSLFFTSITGATHTSENAKAFYSYKVRGIKSHVACPSITLFLGRLICWNCEGICDCWEDFCLWMLIHHQLVRLPRGIEAWNRSVEQK